MGDMILQGIISSLCLAISLCSLLTARMEKKLNQADIMWQLQ